MTAKTITLSNGLTILLDHFNSNTLSIGLWLNVGSVNENNKQLGIAHMLEHMAFKGTKNRNAFDISKEIEDVGGDINAYTSKENTAYYVKLLPSNYELGIEILSDIFLNSTFPKEEIERERGVIISEIGQSNDMPDDKVFDKFYSLAYQNQSIGKPILGTKVSVGGFDKDDLTKRYLKWWENDAFDTGPTYASVFSKIVMGTDPDEAVRQTHKEFDQNTAGCGPAHRCAPLAGFMNIPSTRLISIAR